MGILIIHGAPLPVDSAQSVVKHYATNPLEKYRKEESSISHEYQFDKKAF